MREFICTAFLMKEPRILRFKRLRDRQTDRPTDQPTDRPTDRRTDTTSYRDARTHLKIDDKFQQFLSLNELYFLVILDSRLCVGTSRLGLEPASAFDWIVRFWDFFSNSTN